eukprot:1647324-Pyramimonas_sp.AAC.1
MGLGPRCSGRSSAPLWIRECLARKCAKLLPQEAVRAKLVNVCQGAFENEGGHLDPVRSRA